MQDKIIVTPSEVRGLGNIVSEKELEDFLVYMSTITSTSEEVDGITRKVYALGYVPPQVSLTLTLEKTVLDYDEHTNLIATLLDENNVGIPNEEVKFYNENSYLFYTGTTDSNGVITINIYSHQPGQHTYTGVLTSDTDITGSVTVTINKITSNISLSASSSSITYGDSVTLSGTLSAGSGKSVKIYNGDSLVDTVTTGSGGAFTKSVSGLNVGSHSFTVVYDGDTTYTEVTSSAVSVNVIAPSYDDIVVSADKQILSYADSEKATLYAQLQDNGSDAAVSGVTITFKQGNTTLGTAQTDNTGKATLVDGYTSAGVGDVSITATDGTLSSETYALEDCFLYDTTTHSRTHTSSSAVSNTVINGFSWDNTDDWIFTCELSVSGMGQRIDIVPPSESLSHHLGFGKSTDNNYFRCYIGKTGSGEEWKSSNVNMDNGTFYPVQVKKEGTDVEFQYQGNVVDTSDYPTTWLSNYSTETFKFTQWRANSISIRNIKIKRL